MTERAHTLEAGVEAARPHWIARSEHALSGHIEPDIEVLPGAPPPVLDAVGRRALLAPLLASFLWSAALLMDQLRGELDSIGLLLRLLALAVLLRSVLLGRELLSRARVYARHRRYGLALCDEGLLLRTPETDIAIQKADIIDIRAEAQPAQRREGPTWGDVYLITKPDSGRTWVALPPVFARVPGLLVDQLSAWRGTVEAAPETDAPTTVACARKSGLPRRGPYATVLLGVVLLESYLRLPESARSQSAGWVALVVVSCTLVVPGLWLLAMRLRFGPKGGALLTLQRSRLTVHRGAPKPIPWTQVTNVTTLARSSWSLLLGAHRTRSLNIGLFDASAVRLDDDVLADPVEVVGALCEAYRHGLLR